MNLDLIKQKIPIIIEGLKSASKKILEIYSEDFDVEIKNDNSPVTIADKLASKIIIKYLGQFNIPIISEEEVKLDYDFRKNEKYIWLVDPIDGTKEFIKKNDQFCICIALIENGKPILGFIASPTTQTILFGGRDLPATEISYNCKTIFDEKWQINSQVNKKQKTLVHSNAPFSDTSLKFVHEIEKKHGKLAVIRKGSALKFFDLTKGNADFYTRLAPTMEWDIAAGQAIYESVGGEVVDFTTKKPLTYNKPKLKNPYFLAKLKTTKL